MLITIRFLLVASFIATPLHAHDCVYVFSHGLGCNQTQSVFYEKVLNPKECPIESLGQELIVTYKTGQRRSWMVDQPHDFNFWVIQPPIISFNFPDAHLKYGFDRAKTSLGQHNEILALTNAYHQAKSQTNKIVLMGMSRGAATIINFLALQQPDHIAAVVIESPFDSIINTLQTKLQDAHISWIPKFIADTAPYALFGEYNRNGISPISVTHKVKQDVPLLIICSLEDTIVPAKNSANIYYKLIESGHKDVYLLLTNKGPHGHLLWHADGDLYMNVVHAFYKKYSLPYHATFAQHGEYILEQCQPSKKTVEQAFANNLSYITR